jgi:hypothetical protein
MGLRGLYLSHSSPPDISCKQFPLRLRTDRCHRSRILYLSLSPHQRIQLDNLYMMSHLRQRTYPHHIAGRLLKQHCRDHIAQLHTAGTFLLSALPCSLQQSTVHMLSPRYCHHPCSLLRSRCSQ